MDLDCYCTSMRVATRKLSACYDEAIAAAGVNIAQLTMLRRLRRLGPVRLTELSEALVLDRTTVSRNAKVLERMGFIERDAGTDRRESVVSLSGRGAEAVEAADPLWEQAQRDFEERMGAEQADILRTMLHAV